MSELPVSRATGNDQLRVVPRGDTILLALRRRTHLGRLGVKEAAQGRPAHRQKTLFEEVQPQWVEVDMWRVRVENRRDFGGPWLALEMVRRLGLKEFLDATIPKGQEEIPWSAMALVLVISRLCDPSSELHIAEHFYGQTATAELLGVPACNVNEQRLYRGLDIMLPHKEALEIFLKNDSARPPQSEIALRTSTE